MDRLEQKEEFIRLLRSTGREGVDDVICELEKMGFFDAPASAGHHLNVEGGLVEHSLNVCRCALMLREQMENLSKGTAAACPRDSVIIASLLHDTCKADIYKPIVKKRKNAYGYWEDVNGYDVIYDEFPMGHGEKSVIVLLCAGLQLTDDEMLAIRWHMGPWGLIFNSYEDKRCYETAQKNCPLVTIIRTADSLAANLMETESD